MSEIGGNNAPGGGTLDMVYYQLQELFKLNSRTEEQIERLETKMDNRLDRLQYVDKAVYAADKIGVEKRLDSHFSLIVAIIGLQITLIVAFVGYLVVAA